MATPKNEFDDKAKMWDKDSAHSKRAQVIADAIIAEIPNDPLSTAMEYGCGTGLLSFLLKDRFAKITMIDTSQGMLDVLHEKIKDSGTTNMEVVNSDLLETSPGSLGQFSVIYSSMVLHHVDNTDAILKAFYNHLSSPGFLCIADLDAEDGLFHGDSFTGHNGFSRDDLGTRARAAGFSEVKFRTVHSIEKVGRDEKMHSFPVFLMVCKKG